MPLVYQQNINAFSKLGVWHIAEAEAFFLQKVPLQNEITHPHKRLQHLAGRLVLRELFEDFPIDLIKIENTKTAMVDVPITNLSFSKSLLFIEINLITARVSPISKILA